MQTLANGFTDYANALRFKRSGDRLRVYVLGVESLQPVRVYAALARSLNGDRHQGPIPPRLGCG